MGGRWCLEGDPVSQPCPVGHYCSAMNTSDCNADAGPQPCPVYTFRNETGGEKPEDCMNCPPGYYCNTTGLADYDSYSCPLGYYCVGGGQPPVFCPAGTLSANRGANSSDTCTDCTAGFYCPDPTITGIT